MRRRKGKFDDLGTAYCDAELREMRSKDEIPEMYLALRKIGRDAPQSGVIPLPAILNKSFQEMVLATLRKFYTRKQIKKWEAILQALEEDAKKGHKK